MKGKFRKQILVVLSGLALFPIVFPQDIFALSGETPLAGLSVLLDNFHETTDFVSIPGVDPSLKPESALRSYQNLGVAQVSNYLNIREKAELNANIIGKLTNHAACEILNEAGEWVEIESGGVRGFVSAEYLLTGQEARDIATQNAYLTAQVEAKVLNVRTKPDEESSIWTEIYDQEEYEILEKLDNWVKIRLDTSEGYIHTDFATLTYRLPHATSYESTSYTSDIREKVVEYALQFLGNPYVWGGTDPNTGADCSGFVQYVLKKAASVKMNRTSVEQAMQGSPVKASQLKPGDLLFYGSGSIVNHVGKVLGDQYVKPQIYQW
ncbi:hypothetical protein FACS189418_7140 [Clostridia bacterium]|nr:hypothetical protein FACS189418_7140 [Clostridia bacterium]